ncbi:acyl-CoA thioesterase [Limnobaculum zhutongyuii]|uniref:Acyl-CoA thioesterase n=1 Tax=Limnobaculum zhutongyuii TaxID=2498113 RepID=A0A411WQS3_9GAMM|nr:thioesterase family protein [Limnobaculum zhutongyuii]QBH98571.1 acyl-CoA thioesterase [Limnobaculum zhutongyuii]TQS86852.1 acyl-CoA thioesterase [Limnobaculum zhutongyuii]
MNLNSDPRLSVDIELTVPFHDVDSMHVVWHGNYFRYFEVAREALLKQFDYGYRQMSDSGYAWPVIDTRVKYIAPACFEQKIRVNARLTEYENRLRIDYLIVDVASGKKLTKGYTIQVAVNQQNGEMCFVSPSILFDKLGVQP